MWRRQGATHRITSPSGRGRICAVWRSWPNRPGKSRRGRGRDIYPRVLHPLYDHSHPACTDGMRDERRCAGQPGAGESSTVGPWAQGEARRPSSWGWQRAPAPEPACLKTRRPGVHRASYKNSRDAMRLGTRPPTSVGRSAAKPRGHGPGRRFGASLRPPAAPVAGRPDRPSPPPPA